MHFIINEPDDPCESFFENFDDLWARPNQRTRFQASRGDMLNSRYVCCVRAGCGSP